MELDALSILTIVGIIATVIGTGIGLVKAYYWHQDRKPNFRYEKFREREVWHIRILHPDKPINKIAITMNDQPLPLSDKKELYERTMSVGEGQNFEVGKDVNSEVKIIIKYDKYEIKKKFSKITLSKDSS